MTTKAELEKMVELEAEKYAEEKLPPVLQTEYHLIQHENSFKSGCSYVTGILMPEIEYLKSGVHTCHDQCPKPICVKFRDKDATIQSLKDEIEVLRRYGNKDCTAMADEALTQKAEE